MSKKFVLKDATRKRCQIIALNEQKLKMFKPISLEFFHFLSEVDDIDFSIFIRVENEMVEYIKPQELNEDFLRHIWLAAQKPECHIDVYVLKKDYPLFQSTIAMIRETKINKLIEKEPYLDRKVLNVFSDISEASQMVLRGGINANVASKITAVTSYMMSNVMGNDVAVSTLSRMISIDPTLYDHVASVTMFAGILARQCLPDQITPKDAYALTECALYHDAGKAHIPNAILNKPGAFTAEEYEIMKTHVQLGFDDLTNSINKGAPINKLAPMVALEHHERWNGSGYPHGKKGRREDDPGNGIHLYSRIMAIADAYSALLMKRVYKPALAAEEAVELLSKHAPKNFDMDIFEPFIAGIKSSLNILDKRKSEKEGGIYVVDKNDSFASKLKEINRKKTG